MYQRLISHGKITSLSGGFKLPKNQAFSILIVPKVIQPTHVGIVNCKLLGDAQSSDFPVIYNDWTPALIVSLEKNSIDLTSFDVYWGSGENV